MTPIVLHVYPDGRMLLSANTDLTEQMRASIATGVKQWQEGGALVIDGREITVVHHEPSVEDRLVAIEERLGLRPVAVR